MNESKPTSPETGANEQADLLMALLGDEGAAAALGVAADGIAGADAYAQLGKKEIRARVAKLAAERPEMLARIITHWIKEERNKGR